MSGANTVSDSDTELSSKETSEVTPLNPQDNHSRFFRFGTFRYLAISVESLAASQDAVERAMPQSSWTLQPNSADSRQPAGEIQLNIVLTGAKGPVTGRFYFSLRTSQGEKRSHVWFATDDNGRARVFCVLPGGVTDLSLVLYSSDALQISPQVVINQIGKIQRYAPKVYDLLRYHFKHPEAVVSKFNKAYLLLRRGGVRALKDRLLRRDQYPEWIARYDTISDDDRLLMQEHIEKMSYKPTFSVLMPVYNVPETYLRQAIDSVRSQVYPYWQLCIADDNSPNAAVREVIKEYAALDPRIVYVFRTTNGHISQATNSAAELATGEFLAFLDNDDEIREHALYMMARELEKHPDADLIYSDEDKITPDGVRHDPYFKSDWNPELLLCHNCICHFTAVRASRYQQVGGLRKECNGAQDWDLALRISEVTTRDKIRHIPHILYHWRVIEGSTAKETAAKPYVTAAQIRAVSEHLERKGDSGAKVESIPELSMLRVRYATPNPQPLVSLIVPTFNQYQLLSQCVEGILNGTSYKNIELIIVDNRSNDPRTLEYLSEIPTKDSRVKVVRDDGAFNFSRINNDAVKHAKGAILGFVNNDIQVIRPDWLDEMVANLVRKDIGAVGARLLFPNGTVQHAGVITGIGGVAGHQFKNISVGSLGYFCRAILPQNLSAVTAACMLVHTEVFKKVGGFDQESLAVAFNDIDLCLKIRESGYLIVYTPYAELLHHESVSRGYEDSPEKKARFAREFRAMQERWGDKLLSDPYYNPNFKLENVGYELGRPPKRFG
jgi:GT2 family glycosyltransferase